MKNGTSSSGSSSSSSARKETNQTKENQPIKKQDNADASERPNNLLTKDAK